MTKGIKMDLQKHTVTTNQSTAYQKHLYLFHCQEFKKVQAAIKMCMTVDMRKRIKFRRNDTNNSNDKTSVKFNPYISQIPTNGLSILAYKERLYNERADWIRSTINQTEDFFVNVFIPVDPELSIIWIKARNEWVTENLDNKKPTFQTTIYLDKSKPSFPSILQT
ncbi:MAG: hypothetical protein IPQ27_13275 [Chitinophagaceae bacterium]|nr:hypothetical protein [Chitinophagaceae bacterium]